MVVYRNLLESGRGHFGTVLEISIQWFYSKVLVTKYLLFLQYGFTLTAKKMTTAIAYQRNILEIQKPVKVHIRPRTTHFCQKIRILSRVPGPLKLCLGGQGW